MARPVESGERGKAPSAVRWRVALSARGLQPAVATLDDAVFVSTGEGLSIFDRQTGRTLGRFKNGSPELLSAPAMGKGYAGIDNELYVTPKTGMLFADAKQGLADLVAAVKAL